MSWELTKCVHSYLNVSNRCRYTIYIYCFKCCCMSQNFRQNGSLFVEIFTTLFKKGVHTHWFPGLGIRSSVFWAKKWANERFAQKNERFAHLLLFGEQPEWLAHGRSFLVSNLSESLMVPHFGERPERFAHIAHFWWATWAIRSHRSPKKREWANC